MELAKEDEKIIKKIEREEEQFLECWIGHMYNQAWKKNLIDSGYTRTKTHTEISREFAVRANQFDFFSDVKVLWSHDKDFDNCMSPYKKKMEEREVNYDVLQEYCKNPRKNPEKKGNRPKVVKEALKKVFLPKTKVIGWGSSRYDKKTIYWYLVKDELVKGVWIVLGGVYKKPDKLLGYYSEASRSIKVVTGINQEHGYYTNEVKYLNTDTEELSVKTVASYLEKIGLEKIKVFEQNKQGL